MQRFGPLILVTILALTSALLIWLVPPGSSAPDASSGHEDAPGGEMVTALPAWPEAGAAGQLEVTSKGEGKAVELQYQFKNDVRFALELEQRMTLQEGEAETEVVTVLESDVVIEESEAGEDVIFISFEKFDIEIEADGEPVEIPAVNSLLEGIKVELRWDPKLAIVEETPVAVGNPQVKRMISLLVDAFRQSYAQLPAEDLSAGAQWTRSAEYNENGVESSSVWVLELIAGGDESGGDESERARVKRKGTMSVIGDAAGDVVAGDGTSTLTAYFDDGVFLRSEGNASFDQTLNEGAASQSLTMRWSLTRE